MIKAAKTITNLDVMDLKIHLSWAPKSASQTDSLWDLLLWPLWSLHNPLRATDHIWKIPSTKKQSCKLEWIVYAINDKLQNVSVVTGATEWEDWLLVSQNTIPPTEFSCLHAIEDLWPRSLLASLPSKFFLSEFQLGVLGKNLIPYRKFQNNFIFMWHDAE